MFNLLFIVFFATTTFSVKSMEMTVDKKEKKIKKSSSFPFTSKTSTKNFNATISIPPTQPEHPFVMAAASNNEAMVKNFLNNPYFNPNIHRYKTALRSCVEQKHYDLAFLLLNDPRIDTSIKKFTTNNQTNTSTYNPFDEKNELCSSLVKKERQILLSTMQNKSDADMAEKLYLLQAKLFSRQTLDLEANKMCAGLKISYQQGTVTDTVIKNAVVMVKKKIEKTTLRQTISKNKDVCIEDRQIPEAACVTEDELFMEKKIQFILSLYDQEFMQETINT